MEAFCLTVSGLQRLMAGERVLMVGIIPHAYQKKMFEMITRESLDAVVRDGDAITQRIKKAVAANDFLAIMTVFQVITQPASCLQWLIFGVRFFVQKNQSAEIPHNKYFLHPISLVTCPRPSAI